METLIAFLLDNIFFVILGVGFLMSLFGKGKPRGGRMPDFGGGPMQAGPRAPRAGRDEAGIPPIADTSQAPAAQPYADEYPEWDGEDRYAEDRKYALDYHPAAPSVPARRSVGHERPAAAAGLRPDASRAVPDRMIDADDLRKAVLWSEILGPPRARKPHGRNRIV